MKRNDHLVLLSWDHHHGLVMALRIERELPGASDDQAAALYSDLLAFWSAGLLPHFRTENECLLARLIRHIPRTDESIARTQADHLDLEALVATMRDATDPALRRTALADFGTRLRDHIRWEERVLFEVTQEQLTNDEMSALGADIRERLPHIAPAPGAPSNTKREQ
jgi:hypothetical protein